MPLDPQNLTVDASLNRVIIAASPVLPGIPLALDEGGFIGKRAFDLLSASALIEDVRANADHLLLLNVPPDELPHKLDACLQSPIPAVREAAEAIARRYGHYLGYVIAVLKHGAPANRRIRPEWDDTYWKHWASINQVWVGGGLVSGHLGPLAVQYANEALANCAVTDCTISLSDHPTYLPTIGAARTAPAGASMMPVFDFGSTLTKSSYAFYDGDALSSLWLLPKQPTDSGDREPGHDVDQSAQHLADFMVSTMSQAWHHAHMSGLDPAPAMTAIVASYIINGHPDPAQLGPYGELGRISPDLQTWLSQAVTDQLSTPVSVTLLHDGTAAARTCAGDNAQQTAVIMLGTALGVGYPPLDETLRPISPNFSIS
jgi:hypothetical protein